MRWLPLLLIAACGSDEEPTCKAMADHVGTLLGADAEAGQLRAVFETRCTMDRWSQGMRKCLKSTTSTTTPQNCRIYLNDKQLASFDRDLAALGDFDAKKLPDLCVAYETVVKRAQQCETLPTETRAELAARLAEHQAVWARLVDKSSLAANCGAAVTAVRNAAPDCFK